MRNRTWIKLPFARAAVVGRTRKGKTWLMLRILDVTPHWIMIDPCDEYSSIAEQVFRERPWSEIKAEILYHAREGHRIAAVIIPKTEDETQFSLAAQLAFDLGHMLFAADEAHEYVTSSSIPPAFRRLTRRGMKRGVQAVLISQRHVELNTNYLSQVDLLISFQQLLKRDVDFLSRYVEHEDLGNILKNLDVGEYIVAENGSLVEP